MRVLWSPVFCIPLCLMSMVSARAFAALRAQGIAGAASQQRLAPCRDDPTRQCVAQIVARTKDGVPTIEFADQVHAIAYRFNGKAAGEANIIRGAVLERFGPPTFLEPPTWCEPPNGSARCRADGPRLEYSASSGGGGTLSLIGGGP